MDQPQQTSSFIPAAFSKLAFSPLLSSNLPLFYVPSCRAQYFLPLFLSFWTFLTSAPQSFFIYTIYGDEYGFSAMKENLKIRECRETGDVEGTKQLHLKSCHRKKSTQNRND